MNRPLSSCIFHVGKLWGGVCLTGERYSMIYRDELYKRRFKLEDKGQNSGREHLEVILDKCMHSAEINVDGASGCGWQ